MKLLIITQKVDQYDSFLGFFHDWIIEFAAHFDTIEVICLEKGSYSLPASVRVHSLSKEKGASRLAYLANFYSYIWSLRREYDAVFVHMNPVYVVLGGIIWKMMRKPIYLWYVHRSVDAKLRIAATLVDGVFTATKESFRIPAKHVFRVGHGIDTGQYASIIRPTRIAGDPLRIIHVGRITKVKNIDTFIMAAGILKDTWAKQFEIVLVGDAATAEDQEYKKALQDRVRASDLSGIVRFSGSVPNKDISREYAQADASVNLTPTGGTDKSVLESLASGVPVFFSNAALLEIVSPYENLFHIQYRDADMLAEKIRTYFARTDTSAIEQKLRSRVLERFSVSSLISRVSSHIHDTSR